ncbi:hypothetical protein JW898_01190 [Candidatus Woesearchaeota archaeon]|nr:hypothetical protein [Candidatus Woesearchaeota archaeon]
MVRSVRFFSGRYGKMTVMTLIALILGLILAAAIIIPGAKTLFRTKGSFDALGPSKCTDSDRTKPISEFNETIRMYALRERRPGVPNELYSPEDAIRHFQLYLACKKEGAFPVSDITSTERAIINNAKAAYVSWGEDICRRYCSIAPSYRSERKDVDEEYAELVDLYYETFEDIEDDVEFAGPSSCNNAC